MNKRQIEERNRILNYYSNISNNLGISFLTSFIAGLISAVLIAILLGQELQEIYTKFTPALFTWGVFMVILFLLFYFCFLIIFVLIPKNIDLKRLDTKKV